MNYLSMNKLGAQEISPKVIQFGIFLPGVDSGSGYAVSVKIIHETDQYLQAVQPVLVAQAHSVDPTYGDYWSGQIDLNTAPPPPGSIRVRAARTLRLSVSRSQPHARRHRFHHRSVLARSRRGALVCDYRGEHPVHIFRQ